MSMGLMNDHHTYSYSQLSSVSECPYGFYLERIEKVETLSNAFAEQGTLIHELIDEWARGKLTKDQLPEEYDRRYADAVVTQFPRILAAKGYTQKAYQVGLEYFQNFDEFAGYKIIGTEEKFKIDLPLSDGTTRPFVGVIDLILEDEMTGELIICDHKSKSKTSFKKAENEMYRQQLMYAAYVKEKLGRFPDRLMFNLFKENGEKMERPFTTQDYDQTMAWAEEMILKIENFEFIDWLETKPQDFFCCNICSVRKVCPNGIEAPYKPKAK